MFINRKPNQNNIRSQYQTGFIEIKRTGIKYASASRTKTKKYFLFTAVPPVPVKAIAGGGIKNLKLSVLGCWYFWVFNRLPLISLVIFYFDNETTTATKLKLLSTQTNKLKIKTKSS